MEWVQIGVWGDSLVHGGVDLVMGGWVNRLRLYLANWGLGDHTFNLGLGGQNSAEVLARIETELTFRTHHIDHVLVSVGINDFVYEPKRISVDAYRQNLEEIVARVRACGKTPHLLSLTPCRNIDPAAWQAFCDASREVAQRLDVHWIDLSHAFPLDDLTDNVHPGAEGHKKMSLAVIIALRAAGVIPAEEEIA